MAALPPPWASVSDPPRNASDGLVAEWLRSGLQIRARRFDSGPGLQIDLQSAVSEVEDPLRTECADLRIVGLSVLDVADHNYAAGVLDHELVMSHAQEVAGAFERPLGAERSY